MIAVDTNVLVRHVVEDDAAQTARARALLAAHDEVFVADVVLCELVWVLETAYDVGRRDVAAVLERLLRSRQVVVSDGEAAARALAAYRAGKGDFADYLIREHARRAGFDRVATFDRALYRDAGFVPA